MSSAIKRTTAIIVAFVAVAALGRLIRASVPQVPSNTWAAAGDMASGRAGAAATLLYDGRVLVTGGRTASGVSGSAERYSPDADSFTATPPMQTPRANHTSTLLPDGRVLVVGGIGADGSATSAAEIYDPASNNWTPSAPLNAARSGHTATALYDGRVVVAGGDDGHGASIGSVEIFAPNVGVFEPSAAALSVARTGHGAALLYNGTLLVSGGYDGANPLSSVDIYDPYFDTVTAGPALATPRAGHSATTLLDGKVLVAGGAGATSELASAEVYDPATNSFSATANSMFAARQHHQAVLLPHNSQVLFIGGTAGANGDAVTTAEVYVEWQGNGGSFYQTNAPATARAWTAAAPLSFNPGLTIRTGPNDGLMLLAGGSAKADASSPMKSSELYGFATVKTDQADYHPGATVTITGGGWLPGETVALTMFEVPARDTHALQPVTADGAGNIISTEFVPDANDLDIRFYLTASGTRSQAQTSFTDALSLDPPTYDASTTTISVNATGTNSNKQYQFSYTPPGGSPFFTNCKPGAPTTNTGDSLNLSSAYPAGFIGGTWSIRVDEYNSSTNCNNDGSGQSKRNATLSANVTVTAPGSISGVVVNDANANGIDNSETGLSGAVVALYRDANSNGVFDGAATDPQIGSAITTTNSGIWNFGSLGTNRVYFVVETNPPGFTSTNAIAGTGSSTTATKFSNDQITVSLSNVAGATNANNRFLDTNCTISAVTTQPTDAGIVYGANAAFTAATSDATATVQWQQSTDGGTNFSNLPGATNPTLTLAKPSVSSPARKYRAVFTNSCSTATSAAATLVVTPKALTVGGVTASNKVYDQTTGATINTGGATLLGVIAGDAVTLSTVGATASFANKSVGTAKTVTVNGLTIGGTDAGNYTLTQPTTTADITAKTLTVSGVTASNKVYDQTTGATLNTGGATLVGVIAGDSVTLSTAGATGSFTTKNVGSAKTVTVSGLTIGGTDAGNYTLTQPTTTADITAKTLTVSGVTASSKVYDQTTGATINTGGAILVGAIAGDAVTLSTAGATGSFANKNVGTAKTVTVSGLTISGADAGNYALTQPTTAADITAAPLTVTGITANNKVYDRLTTATLNTGSAALAGVISGDTVNLSTAGATGAFADKLVANGKTVIVSGLTISGGDAGNYALTQPTTSANITPVTLTVSGITATDKIYDGTAAATLNTASAALVGVLAGDLVTLDKTSAAGAFPDKNVGTSRTVTVSGLTIAGIDAVNYTVTQPTATASITPKNLTISGAVANGKPYSGTSAATVNFSGASLLGVIAPDVVTIETTGYGATFDTKNVGTNKPVTVTGVTLSGAGAANYSVSQPIGLTASITALHITGSFTASNKVYDANNSASVVTRSLSGASDGDDVSLSGGTATFADKTVANGKIVTLAGANLSGVDAGNYVLDSVATATANITARDLAVSASGVNKVYDRQTTATVSLSTDKIVGDSVNPAYTTATFADKNAGTAKTVSVSGISISGTDAGNYHQTNTTASTTADITPLELTVAAAGVNKVYDGNANATVTLSDNRLAGDILTSSYTSASFADKNVADGKTVSVAGISISGADATNYSANMTTSTTANITARPVTVSATGVNKTYDGNTTATVTLSDNRVAGDVFNDNYTSASFADKNVAPGKTVSVIGIAIAGADANNYTANATASTTADITSRALTVIATGIDKQYDGNATATVNLSDDRVTGDVLTDSYTSATFNNKAVGTGKPVSISGISISGPDASNYALANPTASTTASISMRVLTINATGMGRVYDGTVDATVTLNDDRVSGDVFADAYTSASFGDRNVGTGKVVSVSGISISGTDSGNYTFNTTASTTADITGRALHITAVGVNKIYDGSTVAVVTLSDDRVSGDVFTDSYTSATFADKNVGTSKAVGVSGIAISGTDSGNYSFNTSTATTANITQRALVVRAAGIDKTYDGNTTATVTLSDNQVSGDDVTDGYTAAAFDTAQVGTGKTVSVSGISISGVDAINYTFNTTTTATAGILARAITVTVDDQSKVYGDPDPALTYQVTSGRLIAGSYLTALSTDTPVAQWRLEETSGSLTDGAGGHTATLGATTSVNYGVPGALADGSTGLGLAAGHDAATIAPAVNVFQGAAGSVEFWLKPGSAPAAGTYATILANSTAVSAGIVLNEQLQLVYQDATDHTDHANTTPLVLGHLYHVVLKMTGAGNGTWYVNGVANGSFALGGAPTGFSANRLFAGGTGQPLLASLIDEIAIYGSALADDHVAAHYAAGPVRAFTGALTRAPGQTVGGSPYAITQGSLSAGDNFQLTVEPGALTITQKSVTPAITASNKVYDGNTDATITACTVTPVVGEDVVACAVGTAAFDTAAATTGKTVTGSGITLTGTDANNYTLSSMTAATTADIAKKAVTVSVSAANKMYDSTADASLASCTVSPTVGSDVVACTGTATFDSKNIGTSKTVTVNGLVLTGSSAGNYALSSTVATTAADIAARTLNITATADDKTYDATTAANVHLSDDRVSGDVFTVSNASATFSDKNVGTNKTVTVSGLTLAGTDAGNYSANTSTTATANITPAPLTVTAHGVNKEYDGNTTATVTLSDNRVSGDVFTDSYTTATFDTKNVGAGKPVSVSGISITGTDAGNYSVNITCSTIANITARILTVGTAGGAKVYDGTTAVGAGFTLTDDRVPGDTLTLAYGAAAFANKAVATPQTINVSGVAMTGGTDKDNYVLPSTSTTGTANITTKPLTVGATGVGKVYDGSVTATVTLSDNRVSGDVLTSAYGSAAFNSKVVGTSKPVSVNGISISGTDAGNYTPNTTAVTTANITVKHVTGSFTANNKVYDGTTAADAAASAPGAVVSGDSVSLTGGTATFDTKNVGTGKTVTLSGAALSGGDAANYQLDGVDTTTANITKAILTITPDGGKFKTFGATFAAFTGTFTGLQPGDAAVPVYASTGAPAAAAIGAYDITSSVTFSTGTASNYDVHANMAIDGLSVQYLWDGFLQPINDTAHQTGVQQSKFKLGQTIPAKFNVKNSSGVVVTQVGNPPFSRSANRGSCDPGATLETPEAITPTDAPVYVWSGDHYQYNWSTKGVTAGVYRIFANLADGRSPYVDICLQK